MSRIAYVNGQYVPHHEAAVHVEDRGYQFADGVYEVVAIAKGALIDEEGHMVRLERSLDELRIARPMSRAALGHIMREVVRRNRVVDGIIYMQLTRGVAPRDHAFPANAETSVVMTAKRTKPANPALMRDGVKVITIPDIRWERCDIKSVALLPNCLGKQQAREAGAHEAWQVDERDGMVEGLNKIDLLEAEDRAELVRQAERQDGQVAFSAISGEGLDRLLTLIDQRLGASRTLHDLELDVRDGGAIAWLYSHGEVIERADEGEVARLRVSLDPADVARFRQRHHPLRMVTV